jgi:hypothetical protein
LEKVFVMGKVVDVKLLSSYFLAIYLLFLFVSNALEDKCFEEGIKFAFLLLLLKLLGLLWIRLLVGGDFSFEFSWGFVLFFD